MSDALSKFDSELKNPPVPDVNATAKELGIPVPGEEPQNFVVDKAHLDQVMQPQPQPAPKQDGSSLTDAMQNIADPSSYGPDGKPVAPEQVKAGNDVAKGAVQGTAKALQNMWNFGVDIADASNKGLSQMGVMSRTTMDMNSLKVDLAGKLSSADDSAITKATAKIFEMGAPVAALMATGLGPLTSTLASTGVDMATLDPHQERLSNLVLEHVPELKNWLVVGNALDWMSTKPGESDWEGRFKNGLESAGVAGATALMFRGLIGVSNAAKSYLTERQAELALSKFKPAVAGPEIQAFKSEADVAAAEAKRGSNVAPADHPMYDTSTVVQGENGAPLLNTQNKDAATLGMFYQLQTAGPRAYEPGVSTSWQALSAEAKSIASNPDALLERIKTFDPHTSPNFTAAERAAVDYLRTSSQDYMMKAAERALSTGLPEDTAHALMLIEGQQKLAKVASGSMSASGLNLNFPGVVEEVSGMNLKDFMTHVGEQNRQKVLDNFIQNSVGSHEDAQQLLKSLVALNDVGIPQVGADQLLRRGPLAKASKAVADVALSGLLGVKSLAGNVLSNVYNQALNAATNATAFALGEARVALGNGISSVKDLAEGVAQRHGLDFGTGHAAGFIQSGKIGIWLNNPETVSIAQNAANIRGTMSGYMEQVVNVGNALKGQGLKTSPINTIKAEFRGPFGISSEAFGIDKSQNLGTKLLGNMFDVAGSVTGAGYKINGLADSITGLANYRGKLLELATLKGEQSGLTGDALSAYVKRLSSGFTDFEGKIAEAKAAGLSEDISHQYARQVIGPDQYNEFLNMAEQARAHAQKLTYSNSLTPGTMAYKVNDLIESGGPLFKVLTPFFKTNANIVARTIENSPLGFIQSSTRAAIAAGGAEGDKALARILNGGLILGGATWMAAEGLTTPPAPSNYRLSKALAENDGYMHDAFVTPHGYIGYNRIDPMASVLRLGNVLAHFSGYIPKEEYAGAVTLAMTAVADFMTPEMLVESWADTMRGYANMSQYGSQGNAVKQMAADYLGKFVPDQALQREVKQQFTDPMQRSAYSPDQGKNPLESVIDHVISKYKSYSPLYSQDVPPVRNVFGEALQLPSGVGPDGMSPLAESNGRPSELAKRLMILTQYFKDQSPTGQDLNPLNISLPPKTLRVDGVNIQLTPKEYDKFQMLIGGFNPDTGKPMGTTLREELESKVDEVWNQIDGSEMNAEDYNKLVGTISKVLVERRKEAQGYLLQDQGLLDRWSKLKERKLQQRDVTPNLMEFR